MLCYGQFTAWRVWAGLCSRAITPIAEAKFILSEVKEMPTSITREEVQSLISEAAGQLVEVLPTEEYQDEHIEGALNIPLKRLDRETTSHLDRARPVIVY